MSEYQLKRPMPRIYHVQSGSYNIYVAVRNRDEILKKYFDEIRRQSENESGYLGIIIRAEGSDSRDTWLFTTKRALKKMGLLRNWEQSGADA